LRDVDLDVDPGEAIVLMGPSGSGKTTLLNLIGGLDRASSGIIEVLGNRLHEMTDPALTAFRAKTIGIAFQDPHLLPGFTALDNVVLSRLPWHPIGELRREAHELLIEVGLSHRQHHGSGRLSGGERQRVGIARALVGSPGLLLADEPTGNLDSTNAKSIVELLRRLRDARGLTTVIATHDPFVASFADRVIRVTDGTLSDSPGSC
jgi:putative ABC transport system ATP-binding protein